MRAAAVSFASSGKKRKGTARETHRKVTVGASRARGQGGGNAAEAARKPGPDKGAGGGPNVALTLRTWP